MDFFYYSYIFLIINYYYFWRSHASSCTSKEITFNSLIIFHIYMLLYTHFLKFQRVENCWHYRNTIQSIAGIIQYWSMSVNFLTQWNNVLFRTWTEPMRLAIVWLLVWRGSHLITTQSYINIFTSLWITLCLYFW